MEGSGVASWLFLEGNVQLGLACSVGLLGGDEVGGDGVGAQGKEMEQPLKPRIRLTSRAVMIYLILFGLLPEVYYTTAYPCEENLQVLKPLPMPPD